PHGPEPAQICQSFFKVIEVENRGIPHPPELHRERVARHHFRREGIATVSDPACGAAGMLIAYAECLLEADINPSMHMFGSC
ncbi:hypothetical protein RUW86_28465, partial [Klebsiella pneumoniae]|nr:hypothetical protein [Klebsiella pneumoniae]